MRRSRGKRAEPTCRSCERKEFTCLGRRKLLLERWVGTSDGKDLRSRGKRAEPTWSSCERKEFICVGRMRLLHAR